MPDQVRFTETMRGGLAPLHTRAAPTDAYFILTVVTPDVDAMVADPRHRSPAYGCMVVPALSPAPLRVTDGHLDLFVDAEHGVQMRYGLALAAEDGRAYTLRGVKRVVRHGWLPTVLRDTTTLYVDVYADPEAAPILRGVLRMGPGGVTAQGLSFRGEGGWGGLRGVWRFARYYVARVWAVYTGPRTPA